jgi:hypothetical protein
MVETIFGKVKNLYVAKWSNNQRYLDLEFRFQISEPDYRLPGSAFGTPADDP